MKSIYFLLIVFLGFNSAIAQFGPPQIVSENLFAYNGIPHDVDNDGFIDIVSDGGSMVVWFKNQNGLGDFGTEIIISQIPGTRIINFIDLDNDGDKDLIYSRPLDYMIGWLENMDGAGTFGPEQIILDDPTEELSSFIFADMDNDGDVDLVVTYLDYFLGEGRLSYLENVDGLGTFSQETIIKEDAFSALEGPLLVDIDVDGNLDILTAHEIFSSPAKLVWYKGLGDGTFDNEQVIYEYQFIISDFTTIDYIKYADINTDGLMDIIISTVHDDLGNSVSWLEAIDGQGNYAEPQNLLSNYSYAYHLYDLDNDGDIDLLGFYPLGVDELFWWENTNGIGTLDIRRVISDELDNPWGGRSADFNGDGLLDIVAVFSENSTIAWYENTGILGVSEKIEQKFTLFPNPTQNNVTIQTKQNIQSIELFNSLGELLKTIEKTKIILLSDCASGIYFAKITDLEGNSETHKIIKL